MERFKNKPTRPWEGKRSFILRPSQKFSDQVFAGALMAQADGSWFYSSRLPDDWKDRVSSYLKAWTSMLNPWALLKIAELLIRAGYKTEAKHALDVISQFPDYARTKSPIGTSSPEMISLLMEDTEKARRNI